jgi:O-antigen/teichoic acid export membrane protein
VAEVIAVPAARPSLRRLAFSGSAWTLFGHGAGEATRFASHLVLAYFLAPEAFGIMIVVNVVLQGLRMFSDVGIGPSLVQDKRGEEPDFYNTAWTIQIIRGGALFIIACLLAWPMAIYSNSLALTMYLPVAALTVIADGFASTGPALLHRRLDLRRLTLFDLGCMAAGSAVTVILAIILRDVWALVLGGVIGAVLRLVGTHTVVAVGRNRIRWDRESARQLIRFGRWIFIATALTFVCAQGDKLVLAPLLNDAQLGLYGIAFFLAMGMPTAMGALAQRVLFPLYARLSERPLEQVRAKMAKVRILLHLVSIVPQCVLAVFAQPFVHLLYRPAYHDAGWILQILALGGIYWSIELTIAPALLARGDSFRHMLVLVSRAMGLLLCMGLGAWLGNRLGGPDGAVLGIVIGVAVSQVLYYPVLAWAVHRHGLWMPKIDLLAGLPGVLVAMGLILFT